MELLTLSDVRTALWQYYFCGVDQLKVDLASATTTQKNYWREGLNQVIERLLTHGSFRGGWVNVFNIPIYEGYFTLPRQFQNCSGVVTCCGPRPIYSRFWDYTVTNYCGSRCTGAVVTVDDTAQTYLVPSNPYYLQPRSSTAGDDGKLVTLSGGLDENGNEYFDDITVTLNYASPNTSSRKYSKLPTIRKVVTTGAVSLYSVDVDTAEATQIAIYAPGELIPAYKRYRVDGWNTSMTAVQEALCKLAYVRAVADTDIITPGVLGALKLGLMALAYEDKGDWDNSRPTWAEAVQVLNDDRRELDGMVAPTFRFSPEFGAGNVSNLIDSF